MAQHGHDAPKEALKVLRSLCEGEDVAGLERLEQLVRERQMAVDDVLRLLVDAITQRFAADRGTLYLVDQARKELVSRVAHLPEIKEIRLRLGDGIAGWVASRGQRVNKVSSRPDPRFDASVDGRTGYQTRSILAVPVWEDQRVIGVLQLLNKQGRDFDNTDEEELEQLAGRVASVLAATSLAAQLQPEQQEPLFFGFNGIIGQSPAMLEVYERTRRAARSEVTVVILGESGTGKELIAKAIHDNSARKDGPFVKVDCAALPESLVENELFGHERGAFTGADRTRSGKVQAAEGGTLFLDEIGELPLPVQGKLLRLLQDRNFVQVGGSKTISADLRFVCATHRNLAQLVSEGKFRADLYYRLHVLEIHLATLQQRGPADIDRLAEHFLYTIGRRHGRQLRLSPEARQKLRQGAWPGNVRELEHCIEAAVVLAPGPLITPDLLDLGSGPVRTPPLHPATPQAVATTEQFSSPILPLDQLELSYIRYVLASCGGNRSAAARLLGIGRNTLLRKLEES